MGVYREQLSCLFQQDAGRSIRSCPLPSPVWWLTSHNVQSTTLQNQESYILQGWDHYSPKNRSASSNDLHRKTMQIIYAGGCTLRQHWRRRYGGRLEGECCLTWSRCPRFNKYSARRIYRKRYASEGWKSHAKAGVDQAIPMY